MAHLYNLVHDIQDVSNNGYYHNMKFKATAEAHGLHIEKRQKYGWTVTTLAPKAEAWILMLIIFKLNEIRNFKSYIVN